MGGPDGEFCDPLVDALIHLENCLRTGTASYLLLFPYAWHKIDTQKMFVKAVVKWWTVGQEGGWGQIVRTPKGRASGGMIIFQSKLIQKVLF